MTLDDLARACEAATKGPQMELEQNDLGNVCFIDLDRWRVENKFYTLSLEAVPKLLAFVKAWDNYADCVLNNVPGDGSNFRSVAAARKALEE